MKKVFLTATAMIAFATTALADCTVTTDCKTTTYEGAGVSASSANGVVTVTQDGSVIDTFACDGGASVSCNSTGGDAEIPAIQPIKLPFTFPSFSDLFSFSF